MKKRYFLTAPILFAPQPILVRGCTVRLMGKNEYSSIEGPDVETLQDAIDDLICVLLEQGLPSLSPLRVVIGLRSQSDIANVKQTPDDTLGWLAWAFARIPREEMPLVSLSEDACLRIEKSLNQNVDN